MHDLEDRARAVVANWEQGDLAGAVSALATTLQAVDQAREDLAEMIERARELHGAEDREVDAEPLVSFTEGGMWLSAWVWVPDPD